MTNTKKNTIANTVRSILAGIAVSGAVAKADDMMQTNYNDNITSNNIEYVLGSDGFYNAVGTNGVTNVTTNVVADVEGTKGYKDDTQSKTYLTQSNSKKETTPVQGSTTTKAVTIDNVIEAMDAPVATSEPLALAAPMTPNLELYGEPIVGKDTKIYRMKAGDYKWGKLSQDITLYFQAKTVDLFTGETNKVTALRAYESDGVTPTPLDEDLQVLLSENLLNGFEAVRETYKAGNLLGANLETGEPKALFVQVKDYNQN